MMTCTGWNAQGQPHANASMLLIVAVNWMIQCHPQHPRQEELSLADLYSKQACPAEALADSVPGTYAHWLRYGMVYWTQDKPPTREEYSFTGWYKKGKLLEPVLES